MKKIITAAVFAVSTLAYAKPIVSTVCASTAEMTVKAIDATKAGVTWEQVVEIHHRKYGKESNGSAVVLSILQDAYYSWSSFDYQTIRTLAYNKCMLELPDAVRADVRNSK